MLPILLFFILSEISKEAFVWFRNIQSLKIGWNPLTSSDLETAFYGLVGTPLTSLNIDNVTLDGHYVAHFVVFHTKIFY
jgi:hypothetical protein